MEVSCISNKAEETRLSRPTYRDNVAGILKTEIMELAVDMPEEFLEKL